MRAYILILLFALTYPTFADNCFKECRHSYNVYLSEKMEKCQESKHLINKKKPRLAKQICISKSLDKASTKKIKCESKCSKSSE
jgi:hypothetical protein